jgi:leucyl aminopeptidase
MPSLLVCYVSLLCSLLVICYLQDMGGAALMLALSHVIMSAQLPVRLRMLLPAVENAVSGSSYRPGDVLQTRAGITVGGRVI